jgi:hypothetical protein
MLKNKTSTLIYSIASLLAPDVSVRNYALKNFSFGKQTNKQKF